MASSNDDDRMKETFLQSSSVVGAQIGAAASLSASNAINNLLHIAQMTDQNLTPDDMMSVGVGLRLNAAIAILAPLVASLLFKAKEEGIPEGRRADFAWEGMAKLLIMARGVMIANGEEILKESDAAMTESDIISSLDTPDAALADNPVAKEAADKLADLLKALGG